MNGHGESAGAKSESFQVTKMEYVNRNFPSFYTGRNEHIPRKTTTFNMLFPWKRNITSNAISHLLLVTCARLYTKNSVTLAVPTPMFSLHISKLLRAGAMNACSLTCKENC